MPRLSTFVVVPASLIVTVLVGLGAACGRTIVADPDAGSGVPRADAGTVFCVDDDQCQPGETCLAGVCSSSQCLAKANCSSTQVCKSGACVDPPAQCASSDDCPGPLVCDGFSSLCVDPGGGGCVADDECALVTGCAGGCTCVNRACQPTSNPSTDAGVIISGDSVDLSGFLVEDESSQPVQHAVQIPSGTILHAGQILVIGRDATKSQFEHVWGNLPSGALYLNGNGGSGAGLSINGGERMVVRSSVGSVVDGPTIAGVSGKSYQRTAAGSAGSQASWTQSTDTDATPGVVELPRTGVGLVLSEWSDRTGNNQFHFEFIELYYAP